jgi:hypothetical protein
MAPFQATSTANVTIDCKAAEVHHHVTRSSDVIVSLSCLRESTMRDKREPAAPRAPFVRPRGGTRPCASAPGAVRVYTPGAWTCVR